MRDRSVMEIDLSAAARLLLRHSPVIAGLAFVFGFAGWVISQRLPQSFASTAIVVVTDPDIVFRFDPRIETQVNPPPGEGLTEVALSDELVADLLHAGIELGLSPIMTLEDLRNDLRVSARGSTLSLRVSCPIPVTCNSLANRWAASFANKLNQIYAGAGRDSDTFRSSAEGALHTWEQAQAALTSFQASNDEVALDLAFQFQTTALERVLEAGPRLESLISDARAIRTRIGSISPAGETTGQDQVLVMLLALRSLSSTAVDGTTSQNAPLLSQEAVQSQFVVSPDFVLLVSVDFSISGSEGKASLLEYLDQLIDSIEAQQISLHELEREIKSQLLELQAALTRAVQERLRLEEETELSKETYQILARKAAESRLAIDEERVAQVATQAVVPDEAAGPSSGVVVLAGALFGALAGAIGIGGTSRQAGRVRP